ncbi:MAG TPA: L,D-transpeptidase family protein [Hyphomicrobiaceae bacterium]|nr:L,D-transpeptidase family protein [Hyphomicrobiaceae bacterium]
MSCHPRRVRGGLKMAASICTGISLATMFPGWLIDTAAANSRRNGKAERAMFTRSSTTPVMAVVSLNQQRVTIYDADGVLAQAPVSTGQTGYETPAGIYTVLEKEAEHFSNLYDDASMPFMQRLTWSGIALHAGMLPGHPASHGCIRMPLSFSERLFERTKLGMRVVIVRDDITPAAFAHPALFRPLSGQQALAPADGKAAGAAPTRLADASLAAGVASPMMRPRVSVRAAAAAKVAAAATAAKQAEEARRSARKATIEAGRATKALRRATAIHARAEQQLRQAEQSAGSHASERSQEAKAAAQSAFDAARVRLEQVKAEMQPKIDLAAQMREQAKEASAASTAAQDEAKAAARKLSPVSVFISRATQRLYVRQAREPVFDTPVTIADADRPMGTYVYSALAYTDGETDLRWNVVSMYGAHSGPGAKRKRNRHAGALPADQAGAKTALDRIAIPQEAAERISELVAPGASLIVSDEKLSRETGKATEFIVVMSGEPQGGIKIRRRSPPPEVRYYRARPSYGGGSPFGWSGGGPFW